ncbi:hypothetical protein GCM10010365_35240 [Streptomyces poonensis]|uniref:Protein kinase domain-containing protein n=1 Tax=Streptomyces poonensis TaxID=68255 RepID=A0A918PL13_9ACTN|nr:hypothetical protein GCM10010365_35240 [Streptomyces poonensis]GLJ93649.1 hypothetical protein GCM10017589_62650 [Streptomyces poonensis]
MTQTGVVVGTPQYLSPERALGRGVGACSDLYSVGVMLCRLVTRALRKNPDERFPSAEAMRAECLRVASSFRTAAPSIVPSSRTSPILRMTGAGPR